MATSIPLKNTSTTNTLRVTQQEPVRDNANKIVPGKWKDQNRAFLAPGVSIDLWLDHTGRRMIIEEMPT